MKSAARVQQGAWSGCPGGYVRSFAVSRRKCGYFEGFERVQPIGVPDARQAAVGSAAQSWQQPKTGRAR
eukprot:261851-Chlamydomonas_euryale.AAC.1